jgi:hypothetical protein
MKFLMSGERLFTIAAFGLAMASGGFGGLMVVRLERMENPPDMMGLDFSSLQDDAVADPIQTGTIGRRQFFPATSQDGPAPAARAPQNIDFRLLSVVDGVAFVEVDGPDGRQLWPVDVGATLPGAGQVIAIERDADHWRIHTTVMTISGQAQ